MSGTRFWLIVACVVAVMVVLFVVKDTTKKEFTEEGYEKDYEAKKVALEKVLGPMDEVVGHAIVSYAMGGTVDMYYFSKGIPGTAMATMELIQPDGKGVRPNHIGTYELVAFTRATKTPAYKPGDGSPFDRIERRMCEIFTTLGQYAVDAVVKPGETADIPVDESDKCWVIFDEYRGPSDQDFTIDGRRHCLLLCMEVFKSEVEWAMKNGGPELLKKLKKAGYYPYSDLNREPVE